MINSQNIDIGCFSQIDEGVFIFAGNGVTIGAHVHLAFGCSISGGGRCEIADFASIGAGVRIITGSDITGHGGLTNPTVPASLRSVIRDEVRIGAHAVLFTNTVVLPGLAIGEGAVVSAGALVHHDLKPWAVYAGNPLIQVGFRSRNEILAKAKLLASGASAGQSRPKI